MPVGADGHRPACDTLTPHPGPGPPRGDRTAPALYRPPSPRSRIPAALGQTADVLLAHLSLLFVPAGVGIIVHLSRVADEWLALLTALLVSTFVSMAVTALVMKALVRKPAGSQP